MRLLKAAGPVLLWVVQILMSLGFVLIGSLKFFSPFWIAGFTRWGYPASFRLLIGVLEIAGGLMLVFPRAASYAAVMLACILVGAAGTLFVHHEPWKTPIAWLVMTAIVGIGRLRAARRPSTAAPPALAAV